MILRTIHCGVKGCGAHKTEGKENEGWVGWGQVNGLADENGYPAVIHVCPADLLKIKNILNGEE